MHDSVEFCYFHWKQYGDWWQFDELYKNRAATYASVIISFLAAWCNMTNTILAHTHKNGTERKLVPVLFSTFWIQKRAGCLWHVCKFGVRIHTLTHTHARICVLFVYSLCFVNSCENTKQFMFILLFSGIILKLIPWNIVQK